MVGFRAALLETELVLPAAHACASSIPSMSTTAAETYVMTEGGTHLVTADCLYLCQ